MSSISLINSKLNGIDPFDDTLDSNTKKMILEECRSNPAYFHQIIDSKNTLAKYQQDLLNAFTLVDDLIEPCKLCGSKGVLEEMSSGDRISNQVQCSNQGCILNNHRTWECNEWEAIKAWNGCVDTNNKVKLENELLNSCVLVNTPQEYLMVLELYLLAGAKVWPWHKGYKPPQEDNESVGLYTWREVGFFKELYPVVSEDDRLLTIPELAEIVFKYCQPSDVITGSNQLMINHYLILREIIKQLEHGPVPTSFIESVVILDLDLLFLKMIYLSNQACTLIDNIESFLQFRVDVDRGVPVVVSEPDEVFKCIKDSKYHLLNGESRIPNHLIYYFNHCALDNPMSVVINHLKSICLSSAIGEVSTLLQEHLALVKAELSNERILFLNEVIKNINTPTLKIVK